MPSAGAPGKSRSDRPRRLRVGARAAARLRMAVHRHVGDVVQELGRAVAALHRRDQLRRLVDEARRVAARRESCGCADDVLEEGEVGRDAADAELAQRPVHARDRLLRRGRPGGHLLEQRIVEAGDDRAGIGGAAVEPDAEAGGAAIGGDAAVIGDEILLRILGGDAALQRVAVQPDVLLRAARRNPASPIALALDQVDLRLDDVDAGHLLGDGVLDLDARIDLDEVEFSAVGVLQELHRAGAEIVGGRGDLQRIAAELLALLLRRGTAPARARRPSGGGAGSCSRARRDARGCRGGRRGSAPRRGGRARPAFRDRPRPCRRRPSPRASPPSRRAISAAASRMTRMPRPPPPHDAFSISG